MQILVNQNFRSAKICLFYIIGSISRFLLKSPDFETSSSSFMVPRVWEVWWTIINRSITINIHHNNSLELICEKEQQQALYILQLMRAFFSWSKFTKLSSCCSIPYLPSDFILHIKSIKPCECVLYRLNKSIFLYQFNDNLKQISRQHKLVTTHRFFRSQYPRETTFPNWRFSCLPRPTFRPQHPV